MLIHECAVFFFCLVKSDWLFLLCVELYSEQERLREIPTSQLTGPERPFAPETHEQLPGSEFDHPPLQPNQQVLFVYCFANLLLEF